MGYKLKHIRAFKRACKDLWKYSKEHREAGGDIVIRYFVGDARYLGAAGLCSAIKHHYTEALEQLEHSRLGWLPYDLYNAYNKHGGYLPGKFGVWTPERVALLKFYCETPAKELLEQLVESPYNRGVYGENT